jgi:hypothetical protein
MRETTITVETPLQHLIVEQALAYAQQMEQMSNEAADGKVLDLCETLTLTKGRQLLRDILTAAMQQQAEPVEKKGRRPALANVDTLAATRAARHEPL